MADGTVDTANGKLFATARGNTVDGMAIDCAGNLYAGTNSGVEVYSSDGMYIGVVPTGESSNAPSAGPTARPSTSRRARSSKRSPWPFRACPTNVRCLASAPGRALLREELVVGAAEVDQPLVGEREEPGGEALMRSRSWVTTNAVPS